MSFTTLGLSKPILRAIAEQGYSEPTPIQKKAIPIVLARKDVLAGAQTGTGKTAGFTLPLLQMLSERPLKGKKPHVRALILTPTRELAAQVAESVATYGKYLPFKATVIFGGVSINPQITALRKGIDIVIATPGRLLDHANQRTIDLSKVECLILDEADRMLDMGFVKDINKILDKVPKQKQTGLFSATMDKNVWKICNKYMDKPEKILVSKDEITLEQIEQRYIRVDHMSRYPILMELIREQHVKKAIIFTKTKRGAYRLAKKLKGDGLRANALHGDLTQPQRDKVTRSFRRDRIDFLVATDIAARGLDIDDITHIINFNMPMETSAYFHRIGRTARMETEGTAITFVAHGDQDALDDIMKETSTSITELKTSVHVKAGPPQKFKAICSKCKTRFELPFKPTPGRAVYCKSCMKKNNRNNRRRRRRH